MGKPGGSDDGDWRVWGQEQQLVGRQFSHKVWWPYRENWDHDHCEFCQRHISVPLAPDDEDAVDRGYVTTDGYNWVCETCFADFRETFGFSVT